MVEAAKFISYGTAGGALVEFLMNPWLGASARIALPADRNVLTRHILTH